MTTASRHVGPGLASAAAALVWVFLAVRSPGSTHHFAPLVVAFVWGFLVPGIERRDSLVASAGGIAVALGTTVLLAATGNLDGPTLFDSRPAGPELVVMCFLGGAAGLIASRRSQAPTSTE